MQSVQSVDARRCDFVAHEHAQLSRADNAELFEHFELKNPHNTSVDESQQMN